MCLSVFVFVPDPSIPFTLIFRSPAALKDSPLGRHFPAGHRHLTLSRLYGPFVVRGASPAGEGLYVFSAKLHLPTQTDRTGGAFGAGAQGPVPSPLLRVQQHRVVLERGPSPFAVTEAVEQWSSLRQRRACPHNILPFRLGRGVPARPETPRPPLNGLDALKAPAREGPEVIPAPNQHEKCKWHFWNQRDDSDTHCTAQFCVV